ncbi:MAG: SusD/RagB family nutrient-binding outer membrane lipoprotein, partial [Bacteroidales bacterium]|nr:SusD/RagB family nutrient-binding outer membrane lipoprotein [Bacteroidales bacterium]
PTSGDGGVAITSSSKYLQHWSDPVYIMNQAEANFLQAEAYARLGETAKAKAAYEAGVMAGFSRWGYDGSSYIAEGGVYEFDENNMIECIMIQKWVSYAKANSWDGWFDRNRTGYPKVAGAITVRVDDTNPAAGLTPGYEMPSFVDPGETSLQPKQMPRRLMVPTSSSQYNPNAPVTKELYEPMWWQVADGQ